MINIYIIIPVSILGFVAGSGFVWFIFTHPEILDKWISCFYRLFKAIYKEADKRFVKYNIQSILNGFIAKLNTDVPNLDAQRINIEWIDEEITPESFLKSGTLVLRMHKSTNQNRNIVNATYTFVSREVLKKTKTYLASYQKDAIDLFVSYKVLEKAGHDIMDAFVQTYLRDGLEKDSIDKLYAKFEKIDTCGLFFPVFITEMTFLGEKIFGKGVNRNKIYQEIDGLVSFLLTLANRKTGEYSNLEYGGEYSKFAIRIVGKQYKIEEEGKRIYINNIRQITQPIETLYLIGNFYNKQFIDEVSSDLTEDDVWEIFHKVAAKAKLRTREGEEFDVKNYIISLRKKSVTIVTRR
ncbi:MAG: hypothetical protein ACLTW0_02615 [Alistipes ihumii]|uniref:hypothetical protein n=1 Tax=Alistipes ihumii TaxID=1470347 RepID=UPI00265F5494|nr:hypothetical protein [Alistipes ihumii]